MADMMYSQVVGGDDNSAEFYGGINTRPRYPGLYVGNLTWWTTDQDVINAINSIGVDPSDIQEVKFLENRNNGQSKGFCVVTFSSEAPLQVVMEKLPKLELYGQNPMVTPYNRQNLNLFESQTKIRPPISSNNGPNPHAAGIMGISSISGVHGGMAPRAPGSFYPSMGGSHVMRGQLRAPRPMMRGSLPIPGGHQMNRMFYSERFIQPQAWNNFGYNPGAPREERSAFSPGRSVLPPGVAVLPPGRSPREGRSPKREERSPRRDDRSPRREDRSPRREYRSPKREYRSPRREDRSPRREDRSPRREDRSPRREDRSDRSSKREDRSSRREDRSTRREDRSSRRERVRSRSGERNKRTRS